MKLNKTVLTAASVVAALAISPVVLADDTDTSTDVAGTDTPVVVPTDPSTTPDVTDNTGAGTDTGNTDTTVVDPTQPQTDNTNADSGNGGATDNTGNADNGNGSNGAFNGGSATETDKTGEANKVVSGNQNGWALTNQNQAQGNGEAVQNNVTAANNGEVAKYNADGTLAELPSTGDAGSVLSVVGATVMSALGVSKIGRRKRN